MKLATKQARAGARVEAKQKVVELILQHLCLERRNVQVEFLRYSFSFDITVSSRETNLAKLPMKIAGVLYEYRYAADDEYPIEAAAYRFISAQGSEIRDTSNYMGNLRPGIIVNSSVRERTVTIVNRKPYIIPTRREILTTSRVPVRQLSSDTKFVSYASYGFPDSLPKATT